MIIIRERHKHSLLVSFLITEGRRSCRGSCTSSLHCCLSLDRQPWTLCHWPVWPALDIISASTHRSASSSLPIKSTFQYFSAPVSGSGDMTKIRKLTSLYCCQQVTQIRSCSKAKKTKELCIHIVIICAREETCWHQLCLFFVFFCFVLVFLVTITIEFIYNLFLDL